MSNKALTLLEIQKQAMTAGSLNALAFTLVNQTKKLIPYKQAIFWSGAGLDMTLMSVSGNVTLDDKGPYALWLKSLIKQQLKTSDGPIVSLSAKTVEGEDKAHWDEWCSPHAIIVVLQTEEDGVLGGLWLERDKSFGEAEIAILEELQINWSLALAMQRLRARRNITGFWAQMKRYQKFVWLAVLLLAFFPTRLSVTAPAEIVAQDPFVISAPYQGVLEDVVVSPGQKVTEGDILAQMQREELLSEAQTTKQALKVAENSYARMRRESLLDPEKKVELNKLQAEIATAKIKYNHAQKMLERSDIKAGKSGIAIFSDINAIQGKPVVTGEQIMTIADPGDMEVLIRIPVDGMIPFAKDADASLYLNVAPLSSYDLTIETIGYQASPDPDGLLTYKVRADLPEGDAGDFRIGWKGTAKIHGAWTILSYAVLRRPLIALRNILGL